MKKQRMTVKKQQFMDEFDLMIRLLRSDKKDNFPTKYTYHKISYLIMLMKDWKLIDEKEIEILKGRLEREMR